MNFPSPLARAATALTLLGCLLTGVLLAPVRAQASSPAYAVLIVGDEGDAEMLRVEKVLINEMAKRLRGELSPERLPVFSYHFNKERERAYCENKLNVLAEDLLFVGVVTLDNKVPLKVVYRIDRIKNAPRAAKDVLERAEELLGGPTGPPKAIPITPVVPPASPDAPAGEDTDASDGQEAYRVQLGSFTSRNYADDRKGDAQKAGLEVEVVETKGPDGDVIYKVLSPTVKVRSQADEALAKFKSSGFDQAFLTRVSTK